MLTNINDFAALLVIRRRGNIYYPWMLIRTWGSSFCSNCYRKWNGVGEIYNLNAKWRCHSLCTNY